MFGFRHSLNFFNGSRTKSRKDKDDIGSIVSITGAYRTNRDEFFGYHNYPDGQRKSTPNANYNMPPTTSTGQPTTPLRQAKSTSDLVMNKNLPPNLRPQNPGVSQDPRGAELERNNRPQDVPIRPERKLDAQVRVDKQRLAEQKKLEKQRMEEQKKFEKQRQEELKKREKELMKEEKLRKEREKKEAQMAKKKKQAPQRPVANPLAHASTSAANPLAQGSGNMAHSTNTLESSISKTSGPPPYSSGKPEGEKDSSGNVTYTKPVDTGSWDIISKHRENISRPAAAGPTPLTKQTVMDLNYKVGDDNKENSEA